MLIAIHRVPDHPRLFPAQWARFIERRGGRVKWVDLSAGNALDQVRECDAVMCQYRHATTDCSLLQPTLTAIEQGLGVPTFPDHHTGRHYDNKIAQLHLFQSIGAPMPRTWLFRDRPVALTWAGQAEYPVVLKLAHGAGSDNVCKVQSVEQARELIELAFGPSLTGDDIGTMQGAVSVTPTGPSCPWWKRWLCWPSVPAPQPSLAGLRAQGYIYFQEFVPGNSFDTRIVVIGDRAWGFTRANRQDDFRASGSNRIDYDTRKIHPRCVTLAFEIARALHLSSAAFDFLLKDGQPLVLETTYVFGIGGEAVSQCPGQWRSDGAWVDGPFHPAEAQVIDLFARIASGKAGGSAR